MTQPATPIHPASTIVLVRGEARPEVLLLLRHSRHGFMANMWVFPGGRVDVGDAAEVGATDAARRAAMRETWEEAGILLRPPPAGSPPGLSAVRTAAAGEARVASALGSELWPMACFARWVTPPAERRRFDTLFFVAAVPEVEAAPDQGEVIEARWLTPEAALAQHRGGLLPLAPPTFWTLEAARRLGSAAALLGWAREREAAGVTPIHPSLALEGGGLVVSAPPEVLPLPVGETTAGRLRLVHGVWHAE